MNYFKSVIQKLINIFETNQEYFANNLPQAAKIGYVLEKMHIVGRFQTNYDGSLKDVWEESDIDQKNDKLYFAWCQHMGETSDLLPLIDFIKLIFFGQPLTDIELLEIKPKKTFDEWAEIQMEKYPLSNSSRLNVVARLLFQHCHSEMTYKEGFIENLVSWNIFKNEYGDWKNAVLPYEIQEQLKKILDNPDVKTAYEKAFEVIQKRMLVKTESEKELDELKKAIEKTNKLLKEKGVDMNEWEKEKEDQKNDVVIIYSKDSIINKLDSNSDPSYIKAGIEICNHVMKYKDTHYSPEREYREDNKKLLKFCKNFLSKVN